MPQHEMILADKIADLEREFRRFRELADRAAEREAQFHDSRNPRLAITCKKDSGTDYPDIEDEPNTYWIKFLDSTYTKTQGKQTPAHSNRQSDGKTPAHLIKGDLCDFLPLGTIVYVLFDNRRWWIIRWYVPDRHFELKYALTPGSSVDAYLLTKAQTVDTDCVFAVYDTFGIFRGRAKDAYSSPHNQGSRGWARYFPEPGTERWEIRGLQPHALMLQGLAYGAVETTNITFEIDNVHVMNPTNGIIVTQDPASNVTVQNTFGHETDDNGVVIAGWDEDGDHWDAIQVECPA